MPWSSQNPPPPARKWSGPKRQVCQEVANAVLQAGGTDEDAIRACLHAVKRLSLAKRQQDSLETQYVLTGTRPVLLAMARIVRAIGRHGQDGHSFGVVDQDGTELSGWDGDGAARLDPESVRLGPSGLVLKVVDPEMSLTRLVRRLSQTSRTTLYCGERCGDDPDQSYRVELGDWPGGIIQIKRYSVQVDS